MANIRYLVNVENEYYLESVFGTGKKMRVGKKCDALTIVKITTENARYEKTVPGSGNCNYNR